MIAIMLGCWLAAILIHDSWDCWSWRNRLAEGLTWVGIGIGLYLAWKYLP